jgi:hypothetical protein
MEEVERRIFHGFFFGGAAVRQLGAAASVAVRVAVLRKLRLLRVE